MSGELRIPSASGGAVYAHILNGSSRRWNGASFEAYTSGNYDDYAVTMTEQGSSGLYVGDFPVGITDSGAYGIIYYIRDGASPAEGDPVAGTGNINWDGSTVTEDEDGSSGEMTGTDWETYVVDIFRRTDKSTLIFKATNAAIAEIRRKILTARDETERSITDTIASLGDYRLDLESDLGNIVGDVFIRDSNDGRPLNRISKAAYDRKYSVWGTSAADRSIPCDYAVFGGQIWLGPVPDRTDYPYVINFGRANTTAVTSSSDAIPYTTEDYKEILLNGVLFRVYKWIENDDQAGAYKALWEDGLEQLATTERRKKQGIVVTAYNDI